MLLKNNNRQFVIFSDIDGTFLDHFSYSFEALLPALRVVKDNKIPLVFCSSKTRKEIEALRRETGIQDPFIVENGGAIFLPDDYFDFDVENAVHKDSYSIIELGVSYDKLVDVLHRCSDAAGAPVMGFSDMTVEQVAEECGLPLPQAELARQREYDEPFKILTEEPAVISRLESLIVQNGFRCLRGGRFFHITGSNDKGLAVSKMTELLEKAYGPIISIGIGDSRNDLEMLLNVRVPIIVKRFHGEHDQDILARIPNINLADHIGPAGWNEMVLKALAQIHC
ncbi:Glucosyl-3-phosphoglycerate/mannosyl-3-phosphoglycerate phosphatase [uncultured Desulfobacterium sp.]|uniref:Glucosyl-3-phosphoglycerate/mannosyl-3-phosphoglycerate phosphatase n=1 Tax=uncultured Desulfobacterium sp. TaxID=201089 RepID=A0A445MSR3_9BACT|nr:Glucosyl-3-phosphoglycerate/mannosyl-3-phosphoglycerate phosphatase [uncultured Desulfobacterium sp.]